MSAPTLAERASRRYAGLGTRLIWIGGILLLAMAMTIDLATTIDLLGRIADPVPILTAWIVLVIADAAILIVTHILGAHLPNWMFWLWVAALAIVLGLDLAATRHVENPGAALSVGVSAAFSLMLAVVTRPSFQIIPVAAALTAVTGAVWVLTPAYAAPNAADAVFTLCRMLLPVVVAALVCDEFRRLMRREMEEALSQASVAAPRLTLGVEASEQLARLDLAAESLLGAVADGRMPLPLSAEVAKRAGVLATELRLHLLASRSKTWLALAIEESTLLSQEIQIDDPSSSAGLLGTRQRAALLSALWLLHDGRVASGRSGQTPIALTVGEPVATLHSETLAAVNVRIVVPGSTRTRIEPGVWQHIAQVGRYREALDGSGIRIDISCLVPATVGAGRGRTDAEGAG